MSDVNGVHIGSAAPAAGTALARNGIFNLIGQAVPMLAAFIAIPLLIRGLGTDRFGVLVLVWMVIGYFSLFDLGLGRALTHLVAEKMGRGEGAQVPPLVWTALAAMLLLGLLGTLALAAIGPWLVHSALNIPAPLQAETLNALYLLAAAVPIVIITAGLAGILSALQHFGVLNAIRIPMGVYNFLGPLLVLPFSRSLLLVTALLAIGRLAAAILHFAFCLRVMPALRAYPGLRYASLRPLFHFGAWMTVTNVVGPLMVYLDRFVIGAVVSVAAVSYYATPYEMVTKLWIVPSAIAAVLFPAFAAGYHQDRERTAQLYIRGTRYIALILFPVVLMITAFAREGMQWWLGDEFAQHSTPVLQCLAIGVFVNSLAHVSMALIQGAGRPDLSAKLHFLELPIYLAALWWAIHHHGILGAAVVWTGRVALDGILLFWMSGRLLAGSAGMFKRMATGILAALGGLLALLPPDELATRVSVVSLIFAGFVVVAWFAVLGPQERGYIVSLGRRTQ